MTVHVHDADVILYGRIGIGDIAPSVEGTLIVAALIGVGAIREWRRQNGGRAGCQHGYGSNSTSPEMRRDHGGSPVLAEAMHPSCQPSPYPDRDTVINSL